MRKYLEVSEKPITFALALKHQAHRKMIGEVVEWSITAVLKTAVLRGTGGSNPSLSANEASSESCSPFFICADVKNDTCLGYGLSTRV